MRTAILLLCLLCACTGTRAQKTTTALNAIAMTVQTAYSSAMAACVVREQSIVLAARMGHTTPDAAIDEFEAVSHRCHQTRAAFEVVKSLHDEAADFVEAGKLEQAEDALRKLAEAWRALKEKRQ